MPRTGQKRDAASSTDTFSTPLAPPASKKTRVVEPLDDPANFEEQVVSALEDSFTQRKGQIKNEGYDSDSTDDGEGVVLSRRKDEGEGKDDDMFAREDEQEKKGEPSRKKKEEFLRLGDIEGQEFGAQSGSEEFEEDEPEDEDEAERRKKAGMGYELSAFNMREEMEEGKFSADGTYVRSFDAHGVHDRWMDGLDEKEIKVARRRKRHQERLQKEKIKAEEKELEQSGGKEELEKALVGLLKKGETVLEALQRLGAQSRKKTTRSTKADVDSMKVDGPSRQCSDIDHITHIASNLMSLGDTDIYSKPYHELVRSIRSAGNVEPSWEPPSADVKYQYKWDIPGDEVSEEVFGPFGEDEMRVWFKASYFGLAGEKVKVREVGGNWGDWADVLS